MRSPRASRVSANVLKRCEVIFDVTTRQTALDKLDKLAAATGFWDDQEKARATIEAANRLRAILNPFRSLVEAIENVELCTQLADEEEDAAQRATVLDDATQSLASAASSFDSLEMKSLLSEELDAGNAFMSLHAGAGGTESCDWADMLFRMYRRYCETNNFEVELVDQQSGEEAGIKSVTFAVNGPYAYGYLKAERGVHRLVRISPYDANSRRHTSFAAADVVAAIADDIDMDIADDDLRVDTFRSSGAGGQHVNTTDSAVRLTHLPTGIVVTCQAERSQHKNRSTAMKILRARVYDWTLDQKRKDMEKFYGKKGEIAWGSQIRSYVLHPYNMVKDHRTSVETGNTGAVLDGDLSAFIQAYLKMQAAERMNQ
jgi:peptide chain release factor 2